MQGFNKKNNLLYIDDIPLSQLAKDYGTPTYIYSQSLINSNFKDYASSLREGDLVCYAIKANPNISILKLLTEMGSGFDVVSANEIKRALLAGVDPKKIVFSGVGKSIKELSFAIEAEILFINIESYGELKRINELAIAKNKKVPCCIRLNPNISAKTHEYIATGLKTSKFGISESEIKDISENIGQFDGVSLKGLSCHIGSQITDPSLSLQALKILMECATSLQELNIEIEYLNIGGGLAIQYKDEPEVSIKDVIKLLTEEVGPNYKLIVEPGRSIVGNSGALISQVELIKETENLSFALIDAGMNDLIRPALYDAWHNISEVEYGNIEPREYSIVGPVCESADIFGADRSLGIEEGSILAIQDTGAYGFTMSSNYNSRTKSAEVLVNGSESRIIRHRETFEEMVKLETKE